MQTEVYSGDGRRLEVEEAGDPQGSPVFLLHGTPGSRLGPAPRPMLLYHQRVRLITYDRPGYGRSDRLAGRQVAHVSTDVAAIADALGIERFAVVGRSGGGPHALACAALLPDRVTRVAVLASPAPHDAEGLDGFAGMAASDTNQYSQALAGPDQLAASLRKRSLDIRADPRKLLAQLRWELTESDLQVVADAGIRAMLMRNFREALSVSADGWVDDALSFCRPWGFSLPAISAPALLRHGEQDVFSPASHTKWLADRIPGGTAVLHPRAAHFASLRVLPQVLTWLLGGRSRLGVGSV
ncbi:alpha/beta fold hydrolase [Streptomyces sp. NPDC059467]|uniref:alpha/beta fold hydrolase n=1 Tax=Streptomyces sp. NPDC059467 TaxID=3346844 RepID=UPI0036B74849